MTTAAGAATAIAEAARTAITYLRVSTTEQATRGGRDEGFSLPAQREANSRKASSLDAAIIAEFVDAGESGTSVVRRSGLQEMLAFVREHQVDYCIVHKLDRLARSRADDVAIHFALRQAGVTLVSTSENIDETPSGMLMHGIMSSIAEFYSRNLANEVTKGLVQKASLGGTVTRAPLGYKNIHVSDELGRVNRTVDIDAERAHLITWAFYRYAEGDCSLSILLDELTNRGLTTRATPKWPSKPLTITGVHKLLKNAYYKGEIHYKGVIYPGVHEPLVDPQTWQHVQDLLAANHNAAVYQRRNVHYLRGSVFCGDCDSRLMVIYAKNRWGTTYTYLTCSGRKRKTTPCQRQAMPAGLIEELIEEEYWTIALAPELRDTVETLILEDFDRLHAASETERKGLAQQRVELTAQRKKLLDAHYAGAVPLDLLKTEQERIAAQLGRVEQQLITADANFEEARKLLADTLDLTRDCHAAYLEADDNTRRLFNQAFFSKIYIDEDDQTRERTVRMEYNQPFDDLLSRLVPAKVHQGLQAEKQSSRLDARTGGSQCSSGPLEGQGCPPSTLVELAGIEPASSSVEPGLLRVQSAITLFSAPALAQTRRRQAQSGLSPGHPS
jgi:site-specific DNA recombinase